MSEEGQTLQLLGAAMSALDNVQAKTTNGLTSDYIENAKKELRRAVWCCVFADKPEVERADTPVSWRPLGKPVRACGQTIGAMRDAFHESSDGAELYKHGDTILVWMNEGDFHMMNMLSST